MVESAGGGPAGIQPHCGCRLVTLVGLACAEHSKSAEKGSGMFGRLVRSHRQRLGLTQQELADKADLGARSIRNLEAGRIRSPRPATVRLLADAFGLIGPDRDRFCEVA